MILSRKWFSGRDLYGIINPDHFKGGIANKFKLAFTNKSKLREGYNSLRGDNVTSQLSSKLGITRDEVKNTFDKGEKMHMKKINNARMDLGASAAAAGLMGYGMYKMWKNKRKAKKDSEQ